MKGCNLKEKRVFQPISFQGAICLYLILSGWAKSNAAQILKITRHFHIRVANGSCFEATDATSNVVFLVTRYPMAQDSPIHCTRAFGFPGLGGLSQGQIYNPVTESGFLRLHSWSSWLWLRRLRLKKQRDENATDWFSWYGICTFHTVDGSEIRRSPVEVASLSHYLQGFLKPRWWRIFFHQQYQLAVSLISEASTLSQKENRIFNLCLFGWCLFKGFYHRIHHHETANFGNMFLFFSTTEQANLNTGSALSSFGMFCILFFSIVFFSLSFG